MQVPAIDVDGLRMTYGEIVAVAGISFGAEAGQVTVLLGPNGAGKTSTVEALEGYRKPSGGRLRVLGLDPIADHTRLVARIGVMLQQGGVYPGIRVGEVMQLFASYYERPADVHTLLDRVGLANRRASTWKQLSGGEQQRLSLALALIGSPEVLFLDEPTAGVDVTGRQTIRTLIRELAANGVTVLLTTHELDEAERVADRIMIIDRGSLVADGTPAELMRAGAGDTILFGASPGLSVTELSAVLGAPASETRPGEYCVEAPANPANVAAVTAWLARHDVPLSDLRAGRQRLEDVFLRLTGGDS